MPSRPSDRLPNEVLLHVFIKGVEDDRNDDRRSCRRLKAFACLARQVCARWRTIIDKAPSSVSFWIAYLVLTPHQLPGRGGQSFAKQLATFHHLLLSSNGCDLAISFNLGGLSPGMARGILNPYTTAMLRLASYAMERIIPYHDRVIELDVFHAAPEVYTYLLRLVATCWTNTSRLLAVTFRGITNTPAELSLSSLLGYKKILPETSKGVSSSLSLAHFCNLDTLTIPAGLWKQGLLLPPNLQRLNLKVSNDVTLAKLFAFLQTKMSSFDSLRSIRIEKEGAAAEKINDQEQAERRTGQSLGRINLPLLHRLSLEGFLPQNVLGFLGILSCQSLESLSIVLDGHEEIDESSSFFDFPSEFPRLTTAKLEHFINSWQSLHYLEMFTSFPIQQLKVSLWKYEPDWVDHLVSFRIALSNLRLQELTMEAPYWVSHYLLASLDTQNLTRLDIRPRDPNFKRLPPMDRDSEIVAPHLKELEFTTESKDHLIHFLSHLEATQLVRLEYASKESVSTDWDPSAKREILVRSSRSG